MTKVAAPVPLGTVLSVGDLPSSGEEEPASTMPEALSKAQLKDSSSPKLAQTAEKSH